MNQSVATIFCGFLLGLALMAAPTRVLAEEPAAPPAEAAAASAPVSTDAAADPAADTSLNDFAKEVAASIAKPIKIFGVHAHSYHSKIYSTSYTRHDGSTGGLKKFNNETLGLYLINEDGWGTGIYRNSLNRTTLYAGRFVNVWGPLDVALGLASGYNKTVLPMIVPNVHFGPARLWIQPAIGGPNNTTMIHLSFEFER